MIKFKTSAFLICKNAYDLSKRTLFSARSLHLDGFNKLRISFKIHKSDSEFLHEINQSSIPKLIVSTKLWTLRATRKEEHINLLRYSLKRIFDNCSTIQEGKENSDIRHLGPMTMRLFHHLELPKTAMQFYYEFNNNLFDSKTASYIFMDLLFESKKYNEVLEIYRTRTHERQFDPTALHRYIVYAAYYKLNTPEALEQALNFWAENRFEMDHSIRFLAMLALNQKRPDIVLDVLKPDSTYTADMNLKLLLMTELGNWNGVCDMLYEFKSNRSNGKRYRIFTDVAKKMRETLEQSKENLTPQAYERVDRFLSELWHYHLLYDVTMDQILCWPINLTKKTNGESLQKDSCLETKSFL